MSKWMSGVDLKRWPELATALPAILILGVFLHYYADFVSDDAFISFRYAEHLASGRGLEWNPGYRVEGYSNFLWVLFMSGLRVVGVTPPEGARALTTLAGLATMVLIVAVARRETERPIPLLLALAPVPVALCFSYQYWTSMRLETTFFALMLLLGVFVFVREEEEDGARRWPSALIYLALVLTRPEGAVFVAVPVVYLLSRVRSIADLKQVLRERSVWLAIFGGGTVLFLAWRLIYFGDLLPNTYYAKMGGGRVLLQGWIYLTRFIYERPYPLMTLICIFLLGGAASRMGALLLGTVFTQAVVVLFMGGDWMREFRLLVPVLPLLAAGLGIAMQRAAVDRSLRYRISLVVGMALVCFGMQGTMGTPIMEWRAAWSGERRDQLINLEGELTQASQQVGRWLRARSKPDTLIAVNHAGAVPYYSGLPAIDMAGLNDLHIARVPGPRHGKWDADYVMRRKPKYLVLNMRLKPMHGRYIPGYWPGETALTNHPDFRRYYRAGPVTWPWKHRMLEIRNRPRQAVHYIVVYERDERQYRAAGPCLSFESGTFDGWTVKGTAFGKKPALGRQGFQLVSGYLGKYLANSYPGDDKATGLLRSEPIKIVGTHLQFMVGGGADQAKVGVRMVQDGTSLMQASGQNNGLLRSVIWDVKQLKGQTVHLEVYDRGPAPWGHVLADHFCQGDWKPARPQPDVPVVRNKAIMLKKPAHKLVPPAVSPPKAEPN